MNFKAAFSGLTIPGNLNGYFAWERILASAVLSCAAAAAAYQNHSGFQVYPELIQGDISWVALDKSRDYITLGTLLVSFCVFTLLLEIPVWSVGKAEPKISRKGYNDLLAYASIPGILQWARLVLGKDIGPVGDSMFAKSSMLIGLVFLISWAMRSSRISGNDREDTVDIGGGAILTVVFAFLDALLIALAYRRIGLGTSFFQTPESINLFAGVFAIAATLTVCLCLLRGACAEENRRLIGWAIILVQYPLAQGFFNAVSPPWLCGGSPHFGPYVTWPAMAVIGLLIAWAIADLSWRASRAVGSGDPPRMGALISPICLAALLTFMLSQGPTPVIPPDDYHFGEMLVPNWLLQSYNLLPFVDYSPARGLQNYTGGLVSAILLDGTAASMPAASAIIVAFMSAVSMAVMKRTLGTLLSFIAVYFLLNHLSPFNWYAVIQLVMTMALFSIIEAFVQERYTLCWVIWLSIGPFLILFAVGQGTATVLATAPLFVTATMKAWSEDRSRFVKVASIVPASIAIAGLATPIGAMLTGAVRYLVEQSSINTVAHGLSWIVGAEVSRPLPFLFLEILRASFVAVVLMAAYYTIRALGDPDLPHRRRVLVFSFTILGVLILSIPQAIGRIDPELLSRPGMLSLWALAVFLPCLAYQFRGRVLVPSITVLVVLSAGILNGFFTWLPLNRRPLETFNCPSSLVDGTKEGMPGIGRGIMDYRQLRSLKHTKEFLDHVLKPDETYLDLLSKSARYFYLGRHMPIESAVFNMPGTAQQLRAVQRLGADPPPVAHVWGWGALPLEYHCTSLRSHLIYRFVVTNYVPMAVGEDIFPVLPERLPIASSHSTVSRRDAEGSSAVLEGNEIPKLRNLNDADLLESRKELLDKGFRLDNLKALPLAWGRSIRTLEKDMREVVPLSAANITAVQDMVMTAPMEFLIKGSRPYIVFDLSALGISGDRAGILVFDISWVPVTDAKFRRLSLKADWSADGAAHPTEKTSIQFLAEQGTAVVPLDSAPRWLLARQVNQIGLGIADAGKCASFKLNNVRLMQRIAVDRMEEALGKQRYKDRRNQ